MSHDGVVLNHFDRRISASLPSIGAALCLLLGICYLLLLPPMQVPDEFAHMFRAYGLSEGYFVAPPKTPFPARLQRFMNRYPVHLETVRKLSGGELIGSLKQPLKPEEAVFVSNPGMNVNSWIPYVPAAIAIAVVRVAHASPIVILYSARLANLVSYSALTWLALYLLPAGRMVLLTVALMPMTLHQASGLSWDSVVFGISFVFCALVMRCATNIAPCPTTDYIGLTVAALVISLCKVNVILLPMLLLIPTSRFPTLRRRLAFLALNAAGVLVVLSLWQYLDRANSALFRDHVKEQLGATMGDHAGYLVHHPIYFIHALMRSIQQTGYMHLQEFVGVFGWLYVKVPWWIVYLYPFLLIAVALTTLSELHLDELQRVVLILVTLLGCLGCVLAMWIVTPDSYIRDAILNDIGMLWGIQGRHFIPFALPALLALSNRLLRPSLTWVFAASGSLIVIMNVVSLLAIARGYYQ